MVLKTEDRDYIAANDGNNAVCITITFLKFQISLLDHGLESKLVLDLNIYNIIQ